ncbi:hypothetical protein M378DRAFT_811354 [Amanita muscaria Koide BX008]|uniref:CFEM domain-containing protein n=1 Tax=Amanita muscaria (strain Koide BX008) TaxID=946122 RepID=A0A0C2T5Z4_AMAMK|nr:hypothetical protein M378DRAFT_811354 [Amanita muscaria Koide BX008]
MKPATLFLALFVASVQAVGIPTPSLTLPSGIPSLTKTSTASTATSSSQVPKCVLNCAGSSIASSGSKCASIQDPCVCSDTKFQDAMSKCLKDCTTTEQLAAKAFQKGVCAVISNSTSATNNGTSATGTGTGTANATLSTGSPSQSGNGALAVQIDFAQSSIFALTVAVAGAVMGGLLI